MLRHDITFVMETPDGPACIQAVANWAREHAVYLQQQDLGLFFDVTIRFGSISSEHAEPESFEIHHDGGMETLPLKNMLRAYDFENEDIRAIVALKPGDGHVFGGGAMAEFTVKRVS